MKIKEVFFEDKETGIKTVLLDDENKTIASLYPDGKILAAGSNKKMKMISHHCLGKFCIGGQGGTCYCDCDKCQIPDEFIWE